jgi:hypothetical protein
LAQKTKEKIDKGHNIPRRVLAAKKEKTLLCVAEYSYMLDETTKD